MLDWMKDKANKLRQGLNDEIAKYKNRDFMEATIAACALVASADGQVSSDEKQKMIGFIKNSDELKVFKLDDVIAFFNQVMTKFEFDVGIGKIEAFKVVRRIKSNPDAGRTMVRLCCLIGASDGNFDDAEKKTVREICIELGLDPADFGL